METVGERRLWSFVDQQSHITSVKCSAVRHSTGFRVVSYLDLARRVAELQFRNRDLLLFFRGQSSDHRNRANNTCLKPTIFRSQSFRIKDDELARRYSKLNSAEAALINAYKAKIISDTGILLRQQIVRWSILQHYEVCPTPMLDVTHSLRIATSFASIDHSKECYIMVIGVPNLSGVITACAEAGLQIIRLSGVCPPSAVRPHIQEGYLLTQYPEISEFDQTLQYKLHEIDFGRRLVAKFKFEPEEFWKNSEGFPKIDPKALYPEKDPLLEITQEIKKALP